MGSYGDREHNSTGNDYSCDRKLKHSLIYDRAKRLGSSPEIALLVSRTSAETTTVSSLITSLTNTTINKRTLRDDTVRTQETKKEVLITARVALTRLLNLFGKHLNELVGKLV